MFRGVQCSEESIGGHWRRLLAQVEEGMELADKVSEVPTTMRGGLRMMNSPIPITVVAYDR